jgi:Iron-sulfur cluster-binding domain
LLAHHTPSPICELAYKALVVGYDGLYYLCCSDWRKQVPMGSVFERSFLETFDDRSAHMACSGSLCAGCSTDPVNRLALELRDGKSDDERLANMQAAIIAEASNEVLAFLDDLGHAPSVSTKRTRPISVRAE